MQARKRIRKCDFTLRDSKMSGLKLVTMRRTSAMMRGPPLALRDIDHRHAGGPGSFGQVALASAALVGRERNVNCR